MRMWILRRIRPDEEVMRYYQLEQPEFNRSFGDPSHFRWESREIEQEEWAEIQRSRRRAEYPSPLDFLEAYYKVEREADSSLMTRLLDRIEQIHLEFPERK